MTELLRRYGHTLTWAFIGLTAFWLLVLVILPQLYLLEESFRLYLPLADIGGPKDVYTLANYRSAFEQPTEWKFWLPFPWKPTRPSPCGVGKPFSTGTHSPRGARGVAPPCPC